MDISVEGHLVMRCVTGPHNSHAAALKVTSLTYEYYKELLHKN